MNDATIPSTKSYVKVLTIAGSDSCGGAGVQADLKTVSAHGCYGMSVITALTAQNTKGVAGIHAVPPSFVQEQLEAVFTDIRPDAVKIGMLYSAELIDVVAKQLKKHGVEKIVLDPVMVAQSGDNLLKRDAIDALKEYLIPLSTVVTPNLPEAEVLLNETLKTEEEIETAAKVLSQYSCKSILIKGGHLEESDSTDFLYISDEDQFVRLKEKRIKTRNNHGTGCTLSSAIASGLAKGDTILNAVEKAKNYITGALQEGAKYSIGHGHGPVHHFYRFWNNKETL